jgi:hypothetical protein
MLLYQASMLENRQSFMPVLYAFISGFDIYVLDGRAFYNLVPAYYTSCQQIDSRELNVTANFLHGKKFK